MNLKERYEDVLERIERARQRAGTPHVQLIAVTKTHPMETVEEALQLGMTDIGENKVQELVKRMDSFGDEAFRYHQIGSLQTNKVKYIVDRVHLIHSLDRTSLAKEIQKRATTPVDCLVQVNIGEEQTKSGIHLEDTEKFLEELQEYPLVHVCGLMAMAPANADERQLREYFRNMRKMQEKISSKGYNKLDMKYLSMGMSNDFEIAIEEGANMVRIGSTLFGQRNYNKV